jgi:ribosome biogenesis GTPase A
MPKFWETVNKVIDDADVLLLVLDARMPNETRNLEIENKVKRVGKVLVYVVSKSDLVRKEKKLNSLSPVVYVSAKKHFGLRTLKERIIIEGKRFGVTDRLIRVGVLGYPNVGKSSLINALKGRKSAKTSILSGCTRSVQKIRAGNLLTFLDTPGVLPYMEKDYLKHALIGAIDFDQADDPEPVVFEIMKKRPGLVEKHFGVGLNDDKEKTLEEIAIKKHLLKKGALPDTARTAKEILKAWQKGEIK